MGCSSPEVDSVKTYVEKVTRSWIFIRISFEFKRYKSIRPYKVISHKTIKSISVRKS